MIARGGRQGRLDYALEVVITRGAERKQGPADPLVELSAAPRCHGHGAGDRTWWGHRELAPILRCCRTGHEMTTARRRLGRTDR